MVVAKRILIITNKTKFALDVKKTLERDSQYTVSIFSSGKTGVKYLSKNQQDVAVLDFRMKDMTGVDMVDNMRVMQSDLVFIVAPDHEAIHKLKERHRIHKIVDIPMPVREFVRILKQVVEEKPQPKPKKRKLKSESDLAFDNTAQTFEFWLADTEDGDTVLELTSGLEPDIQPESSATFQRLAAEEPPMPTFIDGSTIRDLRHKLTNLEEIQRVLANTSDEDTVPSDDFEIDDEKESKPVPAMLILETALDESTPIQSFSLEEFLARVSEKGVDTIHPLPSWEKEADRYVSEPAFLPPELPFFDLEEAIEYTGTVTMVNDAQAIDDDHGDWVTDPMYPVQRSHAVEEKPQEPKPIAPKEESQSAVSLTDAEAEAHKAELKRPKPPTLPELPDISVLTESQRAESFTEFESDDPELAQLATTLTQVALELTADATVLAKDGKVVGFAGKLPLSDLDDLLEQLTVEWDKVQGNEKSRILFATIPSTGAEFMVSTRGTDVGFTLSLIFSGTRPLHDIRRQSERLVHALATMPEPESEPIIIPTPAQPAISIPTTEEIGIRTPIAYLWLLRDENAEFNNVDQKNIVKMLDVELTTTGWKVGDIQAPDYVYIYGQMPASMTPRETLDLLMKKTANVLRQDASSLWDDSYMILQPGRELKVEEIQRFINFARR